MYMLEEIVFGLERQPKTRYVESCYKYNTYQFHYNYIGLKTLSINKNRKGCLQLIKFYFLE